MSVQFGRWHFEGPAEQPLPPDQLCQQLAPYGRDGGGRFAEEGIDLLFYRLDDTEDSCRSEQPFRMGPSQFLMWDGRLDNRDDLLQELRGTVPSAVSDISIVSAAYARWGQACFRKLVGDWAFSVWDGRKRELVLAKDFMGTRPLFYFVEKTQVQWSSILDPLVLFAGRRFPLNREYLAGWFGLFPAAHLTPYIGIHSVPPASYVVVRRDSVETRVFWQFERTETLRYATDAEYEAHFLALFRQSVRRRLRSSFPVLAELSGGMDSSSIVCFADQILTESEVAVPRLDTITYYSTIEPNWDELPYVEKVEKLRGRTGHRIEVRSDDVFHCDADTSHFMATPGALDSGSRSALEFSRVFAETGSRVLLSGVGGDEVLGGAPSPFPQLADFLARGRLWNLVKRSLLWSLALRRPVFSVLAETLALFCTEENPSHSVRPLQWLASDFVRAHSRALRGYPERTRLFGPRPSFQENLATIEVLRRQLCCIPLSSKPPYCKTYPYLDRDLLQFLFALPPDQILRPHQRRSLMRRALAEIVPPEVLHRRRKAFVIRGPLTAIASQINALDYATRHMLADQLGIVDSSVLAATLREVRAGGSVSIPSVLRVFAIERWLRNLAHWNTLEDLGTRVRPSAALASRDSTPHEFKTSLSSEKPPKKGGERS